MRLVKDTNPGAYAVHVRCVGTNHDKYSASRSFLLAKGYADLDGLAFLDYYCDACASEFPDSCKVVMDAKEVRWR